MSSLYLDRKNLGIKLDGQALALYEDGERKGSVPLHLLERVVLRGNVQLESRVLGALSERNVGLLVLSGRDTEASAMLSARPHNDGLRRIGQYRTSSDADLRTPLARWLVLVKVRNQQRVLREAIRARPDLRHPLTAALNTLNGIIGQLREDMELLSILVFMNCSSGDLVGGIDFNAILELDSSNHFGKNVKSSLTSPGLFGRLSEFKQHMQQAIP